MVQSNSYIPKMSFANLVWKLNVFVAGTTVTIPPGIEGRDPFAALADSIQQYGMVPVSDIANCYPVVIVKSSDYIGDFLASEIGEIYLKRTP